MLLFRDVLDNQMVDRHGVHAGKVDGIVAELRNGKPPRIVALENGLPEAVRRVSPRVGNWIAALGQRWGVRHGEVYRVPWSKVTDVGIDVCVDIDVTGTPLYAWEMWLRERVMRRMPRSGA